jgi:UDP-glucose 4-epimerase
MPENNIVVTGACGHIGSSLIRHLENYDVTAVDNFLTQRYTSLFNLENTITFVEDDFLNIDLPKNSIVIHLAAITDAAASTKNSEEVEKINIERTKQFIDKCVKSKVSKFIFPSSTSVYGTADSIVNEDDVRFENPQSPYASSKLVIEKYLESCIGKIDYVILRFGTIFGYSPGMRFHTAINKFCWQSSLGNKLTVWKQNYTQERPYLGLSDCIKSINYFIDSDSKYFNTKYNVLTGNYKLSDIVMMIKEQVPDLLVDMVDTPLLNQHSYRVDDSKIKKIGFVPADNLKIEITKTLNLLRNLH